jgi:hypothetical protein
MASFIDHASSTNNSNGNGPHSSSREELHTLLAKFDTLTNKMGQYPAKDIINQLTMLAERINFAKEIASFLETKLYRVSFQ